MIRKFLPTDLPAVLTLWLESNLQAHPFIPATYWKSHLEMMQEVLPQAEVYVYVDDATQEVVAFVGLNETYIAGLFTRKDYRSQGIGHALLQFLKGFKPHLTLTVYVKNEKAVRFYQREGFEVVKKKQEDVTGEWELEMKS